MAIASAAVMRASETPAIRFNPGPRATRTIA